MENRLEMQVDPHLNKPYSVKRGLTASVTGIDKGRPAQYVMADLG